MVIVEFIDISPQDEEHDRDTSLFAPKSMLYLVVLIIPEYRLLFLGQVILKNSDFGPGEVGFCAPQAELSRGQCPWCPVGCF